MYHGYGGKAFVCRHVEDYAVIDLELEPSREEQILASNGLSRKQITNAGQVLASESENKSEAYRIVEQWRAAHSYPLRAIHTVLTRNARIVNRYALTSGRLKRMESIALKLKRQKGKMDLTQMNDVAGCRAVLWGIGEVPRVVARLEKIFVPSGPFKPRLYDYIQSPKPDGYRGIHLAVQYQSKNPAHASWRGKRVEIQIRSTLQHAWATAVEAVDLFANEKLKLGQGSQSWSRFFALASAVFAKHENSPPVPGTPESYSELIEAELRTLWRVLKVPHLLAGWLTAMAHTIPLEGAHYLLTVDTGNKTLKITPFGPPFLAQAMQAYAAAEQESRENPDQNSVLASVDDIENLKRAFPNYYADTRDFLNELREALDDYSDLSGPTTTDINL